MARSPSQKMKDYRERLRAAGLRPVQLWLPDVKAKDFALQARTQSLRVQDSNSEIEAMDFLEAVESEDLAADLEH